MIRPMHTIRLGIIGAGGIARSSHLPAIRIAREAGWPVIVSAIADPVAANVAFARELLAPSGAVDAQTRSFDDGAALLDSGEIDAALILTPPSATSSLVLRVMERAIPALVEKPVAENEVILARLVAAEAQIAGAPRIRVAYNRRSQPLAESFRSELTRMRADATLGAIHFEARLWRANRADAIFYEDTMVHALDFVLWCLGDLQLERVDWWPPFAVSVLPAGMRAFLKTTSDNPMRATATLDVRPAVGRDLETYEIFGDRRSALLNFPMWSPQNNFARLTVQVNGVGIDIASPGPDSTTEGLTACGFVPQLTRFLQTVSAETSDDRAPDLCTLPQALKTIKMRRGILASLPSTAA